jgi:RNA recognition motif-containing protein
VWHVQAIVRTGINCFGLGGLDENVNERILSAALITFGEIKEIQMPVDPGTS